MKFCIYGAGAIGGFLGVRLANAGAEVSLVARGENLAAMRANGVRLIVEEREEVAHPACSDDPAEFGVQDYLIIALKAHTISAAVDAMRPLIGPNTTVVTAYNGVPYWYLHTSASPLRETVLSSIDPDRRQWNILGPERALGCVVLPATELIAPGVIRHDHGFRFPIGEPDGSQSPRLKTLHDWLTKAGMKAPMLTDIRDEIWLKLWGNLCLNPLSVLTLATVDRIATDPGTRAVCRAMMGEAELIAGHLGLHLRVDKERRLDGAAAVGAHKMSMQQDLERGRALEIDPLVTVVQELGRLVGVATPTIDLVLALVRQRAQSAGLM